MWCQFGMVVKRGAYAWRLRETSTSAAGEPYHVTMYVAVATDVAKAAVLMIDDITSSSLYGFNADLLNSFTCDMFPDRPIKKKASTSHSSEKELETVWRTMGKRPHWPQHRTPVGNDLMHNRRCVTVWDRRFSCLFVYVRGTIDQTKKGILFYVPR